MGERPLVAMDEPWTLDPVVLHPHRSLTDDPRSCGDEQITAPGHSESMQPAVAGIAYVPLATERDTGSVASEHY